MEVYFIIVAPLCLWRCTPLYPECKRQVWNPLFEIKAYVYLIHVQF